MKTTGWTLAMGVVIGLLAAGGLYLVISPPRGAAVELLPAPTAAPMKVYVAGAVANPGVYALAPGSRVEEAIAAAGGLLAEADAQAINLAARLKDGERLWVPQRPAPGTPAGGSDLPAAAGAENPAPALTPTFPINLNNATQAELESLPGIGPVSAQKIIAYRQANGPFSAIEQIQDVSGIGPATFEKIKDLITVGE